MEPYTVPLTSGERIELGQLLLHARCGVGSFVSWRDAGVTMRFAGGSHALFKLEEIALLQVIRLEAETERPLLDRLDGRPPREWPRFLSVLGAGTLFRHHAKELSTELALEAGQLVLHQRHGVAKFVSWSFTEGRRFVILEFAHGWRQEIAPHDLGGFQILFFDDASDRRPNLDQYPKQSKEWELFLARERTISEFRAKVGLLPRAVRTPIKESVRHEVWRRDEGKCVRCGSRERLEFDHIVPISKGGSDTARNIELLCESCNRQKGARI